MKDFVISLFFLASSKAAETDAALVTAARASSPPTALTQPTHSVKSHRKHV